MECKLYKSPNGEHYYLTVDGKIFAEVGCHPLKSINQALSLKNCQAIANCYDLDELAEDWCMKPENNWSNNNREVGDNYCSYKKGFQKALEILGDKKFSEEDIRNAMERVWYWHEDNQDKDCLTVYKLISKHIQSLQQTEWSVEIVMICPHPEDTYVCGIQYGCDEDGCNHPNTIPLLDADNCLILKIKK